MEFSKAKITLKQRSLLETRVFNLYEDRINVKEFKGFSEVEYTRAFESVFNDRIKLTQFPRTSFIGIIVVFLILLVLAYILRSNLQLFVAPAVLFGILFLCFGVNFCFSYRKFVGYETETKPLLFLADRPSKEKLESFLDDFETRKKKYFLEKYGYVELDERISGEVTRLFWLKEKGALTEDEFKIAKDRLLHKLPPTELETGNRFN